MRHERGNMAETKEYKCPSCGGGLVFDSKSQKMKCPYCDSEFELEALESWEDDLGTDESPMEWKVTAGSAWQEGEADAMQVYTCKSCGGEIVTDENTAASSCPFCGNPVVLTNRLSGDLRPDYVIPFKVDKKAAKAAYHKHIQGKRLLPKVFKDENHIDEIKGIYVPFWLFDADVRADFRYKTTRVRVWSDSNYDYTEVSHYSVRRGGDIRFFRIPVDGSSQMPDDLMESIEPFDFGEAVDFQTAYLSGYLANRYDVTEQESVARANERLKNSTREAFRDTVLGYQTVTPQGEQIRLSNGKTSYALYPVWLHQTTWRDRHFLFAMNGQTGRMVGDLPLDKGAAMKWFLGMTAGFSVIVYLIAFLIHIL